jgi:hypothetical protein
MRLASLIARLVPSFMASLMMRLVLGSLATVTPIVPLP